MILLIWKSFFTLQKWNEENVFYHGWSHSEVFLILVVQVCWNDFSVKYWILLPSLVYISQWSITHARFLVVPKKSRRVGIEYIEHLFLFRIIISSIYDISIEEFLIAAAASNHVFLEMIPQNKWNLLCHVIYVLEILAHNYETPCSRSKFHYLWETVEDNIINNMKIWRDVQSERINLKRGDVRGILQQRFERRNKT